MSRILWCLIACCLLASCVFAEDLQHIPAKTQQVITLTAAKDDATLALTGRYPAQMESRPLAMIRLVLNGTLLDGSRIIGSPTMYAPLVDTYRYLPQSRYSTTDRCFAFPVDNDYLAGNGPWWNEKTERIDGCPALLRLKVGDLLKPGANELRITNGSSQAFELKSCICAPAVNASSAPQITVFTPAWASLALNADVRKAYKNALNTKLSTADQAHILAALGTAELLRSSGDRKEAVRDWQEALNRSDNFALRGETAYRLVAERARTGHWADKTTEAEVRKAAVGDDPWAELARAMLVVLDGKQDSTARPIIRPEEVAIPIKLDGWLDESCWKSAKAYPIANPMGEEKGKYVDTQVRYVVTPGGLAVGFTGVLPTQNAWSCNIARDQPVWEDNCVELFVSPDTDIHYYYEMNATPLGAQFDSRNTWWWKTNSDWNGDWKMATQLHGTEFSVEYLIPWSDYGFQRRPPHGTLMITGVSRYVVEMKNGQRVGWFYTLTKHRAVDCHRMMDDAVLVMP